MCPQIFVSTLHTYIHTHMCTYIHVHMHVCTGREYMLYLLYNDFWSVHVYLYIFWWTLGFLLFYFSAITKNAALVFVCVCIYGLVYSGYRSSVCYTYSKYFFSLSLIFKSGYGLCCFFLCAVLNWPPRIINIVSYVLKFTFVVLFLTFSSLIHLKLILGKGMK